MGELKRYEVRVAERRTKLDAALARFIELCRGKPDIRAVYVFGSYASNRTGPNSDLDILVVRDTDERVVNRDVDLRRQARLGVGADIVVVRPEEYDAGLPATGFGRTILATARLVYAV